MAECIYNKGCTADANSTVLPSHIGYYSTLTINDDSLCSEMGKAYWTHIVVGDNVCNANSITAISINKYEYLESFEVGSQSFQNVLSVSFSRNPAFTKFTVGSESLNLAETLAFTKNPIFSEFTIESNVFNAVTLLSIEGNDIHEEYDTVETPFMNNDVNGMYAEGSNVFASLQEDSYAFSSGIKFMITF